MAHYEASRTPQQQPTPRPEPLTAVWLRAHFDPLPFPARMSALARYARTLTPAAYATLHQALDDGEPDERHTALFLAVARRDLDAVVRALDDPLLRRRALSAATRLPVPDAPLERLAHSEIAAVRHDTYRVLRTSRRRALAARLLPRVHERHGPYDAALLLPACPADVTAVWLPRLDPPIGVLNSLARTAPAAVARLLAARHAQTPARDAYRFHRRHRAVATIAAERDPEAALHLMEHAPDLLTARAALSALRRPQQALAVLRAAPPHDDGSVRELRLPPGPLPPSVRRALRELPVEDLTALAERCPATGRRYTWPERHDVAADGLLLMLPPTQRRQVVEARAEGHGSIRRLPLTSLAALAPADRAELVEPWVRRWSRRAWMTGRLAAALPLAHGEPALRELAARHRAHERAQAWPALLACAELEGDPAEFARIATDCEQAWHDRDDVRGPALRQLAGAPPHLLAALPDSVLRDATLTAVQSRDTTPATLTAAEVLLRRSAEGAVVRGNHERAALAVALLCQVMSDPRRRGPIAALKVDENAAIRLWGRAPSALTSRPGDLTVLAELLATHLPALPDLDTRVRDTALTSEDPALAARAAAAWVGPGPFREARCAELVQADPTFASVPMVLHTLAFRRTDLLDPVLRADGSSKGRTWPRGAAGALRLPPGVLGRWLPHQCRLWDAYHARVADDEMAPLRTRADAAALLRDPGRLTGLADTAPQPVAAAALSALGAAMGAGAGATAAPLLDTLLRHAAGGGVRGRAAMASIRRLLTALPEREAVALLTPVVCAPDAPVGTRKEAARALAGLRSNGAFAALLAAWDIPDQHRDVRAVLASALVNSIDRSDVAERLVARADVPAVRDAVVHARVGAVPQKATAAYAAFLARLVAEGDDDTVVAACRALPAWLTPEAGTAMRALAEAAVAGRRPSRVWQAAAQQLVWFPTGPVATNILRGAFDALDMRRTDDDPEVRRDALRRLQGCAEALNPHQGGTEAAQIADAFAVILQRAGLFHAAARLTWRTALAAVQSGTHHAERWDRLQRLVDDQPTRLPAGEDPYFRLGLHTARAREALLAAARMLRACDTPATGFLAIALVRAGGRASSWEGLWRDELAALRRHEDHDTALAALLTETEAETG